MSSGSAAPSNGTVRRSRRRSTLMMGLTSAAVVAGTLLPGAAAAASSASGPALPTVPEPVVPGAGAASVRGEISGRTTVRVATPVPGQTTILRLIVASASTPKIAVAAAVPSAGTRAVTAVGGAKLLPNRRAAGAGTYAITVPIIKPKVAGATARPGTLAVSILGTRLRVLSKTVYSNTTTVRAKGEMCHALSPFDLAHRHPKVTFAINKARLFGPGLTGFHHARYLGVFAVVQACQGKAPQSYVNALRGTKAPAPNVKSASSLPPRIKAASRSAIGGGGGRTRAALTPPGDAVVLVSGFLSQTPFTTPTQPCSAPGMSAGGTWSVMRDALIAAGYPVYTAPETTYNYVNGQPQPTTITPATMGLGTCGAQQLPASMTINTLGDFDINSSILANFLQYLRTSQGVQRVWLVGHSDGGLWSRGALDYASSLSGVQVQSITTIDTPWTGSFLADLGERELSNNCSWWDVVCLGYVAALTDLADYLDAGAAEGQAFPEMTSTSMVSWNARMAGVPGQTPFYAASAIGINDPTAFSIFGAEGSSPFSNPNDVAVGIASQQAQGLVANGTVSQLACFATIPGLHLSLPASKLAYVQDVDLMNTYPGSTTPVTENPMTVANVEDVLTGQPPTASCPSAGYQQSGQFAPGQFGAWPDDAP